jgi:cytochrome c oxidase subunit 2
MKKKSACLAVLFLGLMFYVFGCGKSADRDGRQEDYRNRTFKSNGEQIYFTATSQRGNPISYEMMGMMHMQGGRMACVDCHGPDGKGRNVQMMMGSFQAPDIRFSTLTSPEHEHEEGEESQPHTMEHPPYTIETIKRAITQGIDPAGNPLSTFMPRWQIFDSDLDDLISYLKTLD